MAQEFTLPELGENIEKGDVIRVLVSAGDEVSKDQPVLELETDKATIEVPSSVSGTVQEVRVKAGDKLKVGQVVFVVDGSSAAPRVAKAPAAEAAPGPATTAARPATEANGQDAPQAREGGAANEKPVPASGRSGSRPAPVVDIAAGRTGAKTDAGEPAPVLAPPIPAAPSVRRYARELGVEIGGVPGSGPGGRIGQSDVKEHVKTLLGGGGGGVRATPLPDFSKWGSVDVKPMSNIRRKTAEQLTVAWQAPHVTQHDKADVTALEEFRGRFAKRVEKAGGKLTVTAVVIRLLAQAIDRYPQFAASVDMANEAIVFKQYRHIGVAVDTPNGLLVPVIRDVDRKTITEIAAELTVVSEKARDRKLSLDDMSGGVMTVTNLGGIGGTYFTPILNQPEVAILGLSRTTTEPVWRDGTFVPRELLPLSLSYDHRVIDGADAARFLRFVVEGLENPMSMFL